MKNKVIIISFDAVGARDLPFLCSMERFGRFFKEGSFCKNVRSVYPSVTYPAHTSIVTGLTPAHHGVVNNTLVQPWREKPDWMWQRKYVKGTTIYDEARKKNMTVASIFWPVTAKSGVNYSLPEVLPNRPWQNQITVCLTNGTPLYEIALMRRFGSMLNGISQPELDHFSHASALYTLEKYQPDLMMIHYTDVDTNRHKYGLDGEKITQALKRLEQRLAELEEKLKELGLYEDTTMVILGDHCQMDVDTILYPNSKLKKEGLLSDKNGRISEWKVLCHEADGCCYVYLNEDAQHKDPSLEKHVKELLVKWQQEGFGIEKIFSGKEAAEMGADPSCAFMLEAAEGCYFQDGIRTEKESVQTATGHVMKATHGYHPDRPDYRTFFAVRGNHIRKNYEIPDMTLMDEGPTIAKILQVDLGKTDGRCQNEIFEN